MKHLLLLCALAPTVALAQEGHVLYERTVQLELSPDVRQMMGADAPTSRTSSRVLLFDDSVALTQDGPPVAPTTLSTSRGRFVSATVPETVVYVDLEAGTQLQQTDFLGRAFLVSGGVSAFPWRLTGEEGEFLGYPCQKAVMAWDSTTVEAWFTPQIPVSAGPEAYGGLPGLILVLTVDEGSMSYVAKEVTLEALPVGALAPPDQGRRVTQEEFAQIMEEKLKELGGLRGPGGRTVIRIGGQ